MGQSSGKEGAIVEQPGQNLARLKQLLIEPGSAVIGDRLRRIRVQQGVSIRDVAASAKLSKTTVVRLEAGKPVRPETVLSVCRALTIHVERLASLDGDDALIRTIVHRHEDDRWIDMSEPASGLLLGVEGPLTSAQRREVAASGVDVPLCILRSRLPGGRVLANVIEAYRESIVRRHPGEEFVYVIAGRARIQVGDRVFVLEEGEALTFFSAEDHRYGPADPPPAFVRLLSVRIEG